MFPEGDFYASNRQYISEDIISPWKRLELAIKDAAKMELEVLDTPDMFLRTYQVTRYSLGGVWEKLNIDFGELRRMPEGYAEKLVNEMTDRLFQPILDLPWETYYDFPRPKDFIDDLIMTEPEFREAYGFPPKKGN